MPDFGPPGRFRRVPSRAVTSAGEGSALARWWKGRYGRRLLVEIVVMFSLLTLYRLGRYLGRNQVGVAFQHAGTCSTWSSTWASPASGASRICCSTT